MAGKPNFAAGLLLLGFFGGGLFRLGFGFAFFGGDNHLLDGALALSASENRVISGRERSLFTQANPHNTHDDSPIIVEKTRAFFPVLSQLLRWRLRFPMGSESLRDLLSG